MSVVHEDTNMEESCYVKAERERKRADEDSLYIHKWTIYLSGGHKD